MHFLIDTQLMLPWKMDFKNGDVRNDGLKIQHSVSLQNVRRKFVVLVLFMLNRFWNIIQTGICIFVFSKYLRISRKILQIN